MNYGSIGNGSASHLVAELFKQRTGVDMTHVPYRGAGPAQTALMAGEIQVLFDNPTALVQQVRAGRMHAIAITERSAVFQELPTFASEGVKGFTAELWYGLMAPAATPAPIKMRLHAALKQVLEDREVRADMLARGVTPLLLSPKRSHPGSAPTSVCGAVSRNRSTRGWSERHVRLACRPSLPHPSTRRGRAGRACVHHRRQPARWQSAPVWLSADAFSGAAMQSLAHASGHESVFVCQAADDAHRWHMRYFVPRHEMEMCGHATIAALWLLHARGIWTGAPVAIRTLSGTVWGRRTGPWIEISQPVATIDVLDDACIDPIAQCLGIAHDRIVGAVLNASTSRAKTLVRLRHAEDLHGLRVDAPAVEKLCQHIGSTGLYPFALLDGREILCSARQFPKSSGYLEDPATGIAAAALAWGLRHLGLAGDDATTVTVRQGEAMGSPSRIVVQLPSRAAQNPACWVGGEALLDADT